MKINILLADGSVSSVSAQWHPAVSKAAEPGQKILCPGSLWTTKDKIIEHLEKVNECRKEIHAHLRDLSIRDKVIQGICAAEAPLEIYVDTDDGQPWRHWGTLAKEVPYNEGLYAMYMK